MASPLEPVCGESIVFLCSCAFVCVCVCVFTFVAQDPEPEKLEVPQKMLSDVFYAATDVLRNAGPSNTKEKDTLPARRRYRTFSWHKKNSRFLIHGNLESLGWEYSDDGFGQPVFSFVFSLSLIRLLRKQNSVYAVYAVYANYVTKPPNKARVYILQDKKMCNLNRQKTILRS